MNKGWHVLEQTKEHHQSATNDGIEEHARRNYVHSFFF